MVSVIWSATAFSSVLAFPMATPMPAALMMGMSLPPSPNAIVSSVSKSSCSRYFGKTLRLAYAGCREIGEGRMPSSRLHRAERCEQALLSVGIDAIGVSWIGALAQHILKRCLFARKYVGHVEQVLEYIFGLFRVGCT